MMSFWSLLLFVSLPLSLGLLAILLFAHGSLQRINDWVMTVVGKIIFSRFGSLPFPLIQAIIAIHVLTAVIQGTNVYYYAENHPKLGPAAPLDAVINHKSREWRAQRNCYLVCLSLVCWAMLYAVYTLKMQLDRALKQVNAQAKVR